LSLEGIGALSPDAFKQKPPPGNWRRFFCGQTNWGRCQQHTKLRKVMSATWDAGRFLLTVPLRAGQGQRFPAWLPQCGMSGLAISQGPTTVTIRYSLLVMGVWLVAV